MRALGRFAREAGAVAVRVVGGMEGAGAGGSGAVEAGGREGVEAAVREGARRGGARGQEGVRAVAGAGPVVEVALAGGAGGEALLGAGAGRGLVCFRHGADARPRGGGGTGVGARRLGEVVGFRYRAFAFLVVARAGSARSPCASWIPE